MVRHLLPSEEEAAFFSLAMSICWRLQQLSTASILLANMRTRRMRSKPEVMRNVYIPCDWPQWLKPDIAQMNRKVAQIQQTNRQKHKQNPKMDQK